MRDDGNSANHDGDAASSAAPGAGGSQGARLPGGTEGYGGPEGYGGREGQETTTAFDDDHHDTPRDEGPRLRFQSIVEAENRHERGGMAAARTHGSARDMDDLEDDRLSLEEWAARTASGPSHDWTRMSRQVMAMSRLVAGFFVVAMLIAWPAGWIGAHRFATGSFSGLRLDEIFSLWVVFAAFFAPVLILFLGYIASRMMTMLNAAEQIAVAARQLVQPDREAVFNVESVGAAVRYQVDAINSSVDNALIRLASVETMIRDHVRMIEETGTALESQTAGTMQHVVSERARLIELTESLNLQADDFASAIAERAQASLEALSATRDETDEAEARLAERLGKLENAARQALDSFENLGSALFSADENMRKAASIVEKSAEEARKANQQINAAADEAAASAARNAANVGMSANRAAQEAKQAADAAIETARLEAQKAARQTLSHVADETDRITAAADEALQKIRAKTGEMVDAASADADRAIAAADRVAGAAEQATRAAKSATDEVERAGVTAGKTAQAALDQAKETSSRIEKRNKDLATARASLEAENKRLENLIEEQRNRADRLAEAIATQTERLSKLAEAQLREQEAAARLVEAQALMRARTQAGELAHGHAGNAGSAGSKGDSTARQAPPPDAAGSPRAPDPSEDRQTAEKSATSIRRRKTDTMADDAAEPAVDRRSDKRAETRPTTHDNAAPRSRQGARESADVVRLDALADDIVKPARASTPPRRETSKERASWKEILSATDDAAPIDLGATTSGQATNNDSAGGGDDDDMAAEAMRTIHRLQNFTLNLERRLYGDPPPGLLDRFDKGDRNVFAHRLLRLNETDVKRRIRMESARDKAFERAIHEFLQSFEGLLEDATTSETADAELEEYLSSPMGRVYLLIGATVGYFA